ncbi:MAG: YtfJ family protein [Sulfurimonas sp.]|jgi:predicted transcriptional regulator|nr:YtfJ family protein [Sulfurimonas sp.]MDD3060368.1 YtfJ family protein [Sulfurimonas sp.]MDD5201715.1 YtfJ family protein [Sulfurimonas sp.]
MKIKIAALSIFLSLNLMALSIGEVPKNVTLENENGGLVVGEGAWNASSIKDKVYVLFYVDPDEKDTNAHFTKILKEKKYDRANYGSIAIINLAATWKPNIVLEAILKSKQEEFPDTLYVKDKTKQLVKEWQITDDASNVLIFAKDKTLRFTKSGKMSDEDIQNAIKIIEENL